MLLTSDYHTMCLHEYFRCAEFSSFFLFYVFSSFRKKSSFIVSFTVSSDMETGSLIICDPESGYSCIGVMSLIFYQRRSKSANMHRIDLL